MQFGINSSEWLFAHTRNQNLNSFRVETGFVSVDFSFVGYINRTYAKQPRKQVYCRDIVVQTNKFR